MRERPILDISGLGVRYATATGSLHALEDFSIGIGAGETLALVGESGSGKSSVALAIMGLLGPEARVSGSIVFAGREISRLAPGELRRIRGDRISMVFQDPFTALNPALPIGMQMIEPLVFHRGLAKPGARERTIAALEEVGLPEPRAVLSAYPHQLSGGMQQRVLIATALICDPDLVILDEPTTALDATVEARILELLQAIRARRRLSMLFISHNVGVVNRIANQVAVLYAGRILERGAAADVLSRPAHPYTKGLLACLPHLRRSTRLPSIAGRFPDLRRPPPGCIFAPRCEHAEARCVSAPQTLEAFAAGRLVRCCRAAELAEATPPTLCSSAKSGCVQRLAQRPLISADALAKTYRLKSARGGIIWNRRFGIPLPGPARRVVHAVDGVTFDIGPGEILGLVGESGSGKSTLARLMLQLLRPSGGAVRFEDSDIAGLRGPALRQFRQRAQIVFQNPDSSLNPRWTVGRAVGRAIRLHRPLPRDAEHAEVDRLLQRVGLSTEFRDRYPHQLSGGEKQRVGIARALATDPRFLVCDEPVSALDVSVQATVLNLLADLRDEYGLSYLFISHDLAVVAHIADRIAVMFAGRIVEIGPKLAVLNPPYHPYTEALLSAAPWANHDQQAPRVLIHADEGTTRSGCPFRLRCPRKLGPICDTETPPLRRGYGHHVIACHIPLEELAHAASMEDSPT